MTDDPPYGADPPPLRAVPSGAVRPPDRGPPLDRPPFIRPVAAVIHTGLLALGLMVAVGLPAFWVSAANARLLAPPVEAEEEAGVAAAADVGYCTQDLKKILRRVLQSCGLMENGDGRGCQPLEAKSVAALSGPDFNALFTPLADRAGILQFGKDDDQLDDADRALLNRIFADQKGASWFFVVARSSPEGSDLYNRDLSQRRGNAVLDHLRDHFQDEDLEREVGLLWLGEEFAQLEAEHCKWQRSGDYGRCSDEDLNRSAFVAWIDCRL